MKNSTRCVHSVSLHAEYRGLGIGSIAYIAYYSIGYARNNRIIGNIPPPQPRADRGAFADLHSGQNSGIAPNGGTPLDASLNYRPVSFGLQTAIEICRSRIDVVGKHHPIADKYFIFDRDTFRANKVTKYTVIILVVLMSTIAFCPPVASKQHPFRYMYMMSAVLSSCTYTLDSVVVNT
jgi:hypothetical protein